MDGKGKAGEAKRAATPAIAAAAASRRASLIRVSLPPRGGAPYPLSDWGEKSWESKDDEHVPGA